MLRISLHFWTKSDRHLRAKSDRHPRAKSDRHLRVKSDRHPTGGKYDYSKKRQVCAFDERDDLCI